MPFHVLRAVLLLGLAGLLPTRSAAAEFKQAAGPPFVATHNCTCRYHGEDVQLGELRCLPTADGPRTAQCVMEQNVTSWHPVTDPCPEASLPRPAG